MFVSEMITGIYNIRKNMNRKVLGGVDIILSCVFIMVWNYFFRDSAIINPIVFWIGFAGLAITALLGIVNFTIAMITYDFR